MHMNPLHGLFEWEKCTSNNVRKKRRGDNNGKKLEEVLEVRKQIKSVDRADEREKESQHKA